MVDSKYWAGSLLLDLPMFDLSEIQGELSKTYTFVLVINIHENKKLNHEAHIM